MGSEEEQRETMKGLKNATGYLRHELATRIVLRYMPEVIFKLDTSIEEGTRILALINQLEHEEQTKTESADTE
jgi:ribosome-binding factor A